MIDKDEQILTKLQPISLLYIKSTNRNEDYIKGQIHYDLCKILCSYITNRDYIHATDFSLKHHIHKITTNTTDSLDVSIGLPVSIGHVPAKINDSDLSAFATKLSFKLIEALKKESKEELLKLV